MNIFDCFICFTFTKSQSHPYCIMHTTHHFSLDDHEAVIILSVQHLQIKALAKVHFGL